MEYSDFLQKKLILHQPSGFDVNADLLNDDLFDWQKTLVRWSLGKGRSALFEDCGLGKTPQQLEWADVVFEQERKPILIVAPLAVSAQTKREGEKFGIETKICASGDDVVNGINITNYEKLHKFDPRIFSGVVLDESSILKNFAGKIRNQIIDMFCATPYKLCCTATPAPNDYTELGNTSEFLNIMTRSEMLSMFFINDTGDTGTWRLKGHAKSSAFWKWLSSWAVLMRMPCDLGFENNGFVLPELHIHQHTIGKVNVFTQYAETLSDRRDARRESIKGRVECAASMVNKSDEIWLVWCDLNQESEMLKNAIKDSVEVKGSDSNEHKERAMLDFQDNKIKCLVTKPQIAGFGMNWQNCRNMAFVGLSDSYERLYQAIRRCWRFGQKNDVYAHIIVGNREGNVVENIKRKERDATQMYEQMLSNMIDLTKIEIRQSRRDSAVYNPTIEMKLPDFLEAA